MSRRLISFLCLGLCSCSEIEKYFPHTLISPASLIVGDVVSLANTQKTMADHVMSMVSGKDCSTLRAETGDDYCIERVKWRPRVVKPVYCYRSLGTPTCYAQPLSGDNTAIGAGNEPRERALTTN